MTTFNDLGLSNDLLQAVKREGYTTPSPVQARAIPPLLEGRDVLGIAQTGTGKTAAFALPVLHIMAKGHLRNPRTIRALVLSPTRELAAQIGERFAAYGRSMNLRHKVIFGGVNQNPQVRALQGGIDILVATPGRLLDLVGQGHIDLTHIEFFVLDEADRMLDMGFIHDIKKVLKRLPDQRQNLLFSATMPESIATLANSFLRDVVTVEVTPETVTVDRIEQHVMFMKKADKRRALVDVIINEQVHCGIVFTRTKHGANRLVKQLGQAGIDAAAIHGNKSQGARTRALDAFKSGDIPILVATDIASRGIDVDGITHVFNYDLPNEPESYVHRIGRTARAGRAGKAFAFCEATETGYLVGIERLIGQSIPVLTDHAYHDDGARPKPGQRPGKIKDPNAKNKQQNRRTNEGRRQNTSRGNNNSRSNQGGQGRSNSGRRGRSTTGQKGRSSDGGSKPSQGQHRSNRRRNGPSGQGNKRQQNRSSGSSGGRQGGANRRNQR